MRGLVISQRHVQDPVGSGRIEQRERPAAAKRGHASRAARDLESGLELRRAERQGGAHRRLDAITAVVRQARLGDFQEQVRIDFREPDLAPKAAFEETGIAVEEQPAENLVDRHLSRERHDHVGERDGVDERASGLGQPLSRQERGVASLPDGIIQTHDQIAAVDGGVQA